jgi:hypothetical protein
MEKSPFRNREDLDSLNRGQELIEEFLYQLKLFVNDNEFNIRKAIEVTTDDVALPTW